MRNRAFLASAAAADTLVRPHPARQDLTPEQVERFDDLDSRPPQDSPARMPDEVRAQLAAARKARKKPAGG